MKKKYKIISFVISVAILVMVNYSVYKISTENKILLSPEINFAPIATREIAVLPLFFLLTFFVSLIIVFLLIYFLLIKE